MKIKLSVEYRFNYLEISNICNHLDMYRWMDSVVLDYVDWLVLRLMAYQLFLDYLMPIYSSRRTVVLLFNP